MIQVKNYHYLSLEEQISEILQERQLLAMSVQSTTKNLDGHKDFHRLDRKLDRKFLAQNIKVAFIVDNFPAHLDVPRLMGHRSHAFTAK